MLLELIGPLDLAVLDECIPVYLTGMEKGEAGNEANIGEMSSHRS